MFMVVEVTDMDLTGHSVASLLVCHTLEVPNLQVTNNETMLIDTNHMQHGAQVVMEHSTEHVVLGEEKVSLSYRSITDERS